MLRRTLLWFVLAGCGVLFALLVIVVALAVAFGPPTLFQGWQEPPVEKAEEGTGIVENPVPAEQGQENKQDTRTITVRVTGTPGVSFLGAYCATDCGSLEGATPQDLEVEVRTDFDGLAANVQKQDEGNQELTLQVVANGEVINEQSTTEEFGAVAVNLAPDGI